MRRLCRNFSCTGFTLLEILIVLAISSVLLLLVTPNLYRSIAGTELPKSTKELVSALRHSRSQAINFSRPASLLLNVDERSYLLSSRPEVFQISEGIDLTLLTGTNLLQGSSEGAIFFYPDGSSSGGRITLQQGERRQQIDINWLTGEVTSRDDV